METSKLADAQHAEPMLRFDQRDTQSVWLQTMTGVARQGAMERPITGGTLERWFPGFRHPSQSDIRRPEVRARCRRGARADKPGARAAM
jgi:hypothetical protein